MSNSIFTIRKLLDEELDRRCYASGIAMKTDDLFDRDKLTHWINALVGESVSGKLSDCIAKTSDARLSHAAAAYLLGMAVRSNLKLRFDRMPRIIAHSASDGFHFFWALTCLCHDLGYRFENDSPKDPSIPRTMDTAEGRMALLGLNYDLFAVDQAELSALGIAPDSEEGIWILESVELAKKYDRYRRQTDHEGEYDPVADHGICGALLLYDILRTECEQIRIRRRTRRFDHPKRHDGPEPKGNLDGAAKDSSPTRFIRCGLMIACTVARHNMWLAGTDDQKALYRTYGMEKLFADSPGVKVRADHPMEQMLFFLDFIDTIDPVKWFYLRDVERGRAPGECDRCYEERLKRQYGFMMDRVMIDFFGFSDHRFSLLAAPADQDEKAFFDTFCNSTKKLTDWLEAPTPVICENRITYELPFVPGKENDWPCGVTDDEVNSLLLYMGCGVPGMYGAFYSSSRAYQTFNLLMMDGNEGEKIRVCREKQQPKGIFLTEWERSIEVMADIFRAQCKYARENPPVDDVLFRSDRETNFQMMQTHKATYAMTSTSRGSYQEEFLVDKVDPHILRIRLEGSVPYFDYEGFFGDQYVYADEREVLLPPLIPMKAEQKEEVVLSGGKRVQQYDVTLSGFDTTKSAGEYPNDPKCFLGEHAAEAAAALEQLAETHDWTKSKISDPKHIYWDWKRCYQYVLRRRLQDIYLKEFLVKLS